MKTLHTSNVVTDSKCNTYNYVHYIDICCTAAELFHVTQQSYTTGRHVKLSTPHTISSSKFGWESSAMGFIRFHKS